MIDENAKKGKVLFRFPNSLSHFFTSLSFQDNSPNDDLFFYLIQFSWSKSLVRKWFSIKSKSEEFQTDKGVYGGGYLMNLHFRLSSYKLQDDAILFV